MQLTFLSFGISYFYCVFTTSYVSHKNARINLPTMLPTNQVKRVSTNARNYTSYSKNQAKG